MEGLIGVAVMGIVFLSLYAGMASGFGSIRNSQENLRATQILIEKFEAMRLYNWDQINTAGFVPDQFTAQFAPNNTSSPGITYTGSIRINPVGPEPYTVDLRSVTITLSWNSRGRAQSRTLTSYVARYGIQNYVY